MYKNVMVAVDSSDCSNHAENLAVNLAKLMGASLTGIHVYAASLHDNRFRDLEPGLPERYQSNETILRQRDIHNDLIGRGLKLISESYLDVLSEKCREVGVAMQRKTLEGRNYEQLARDVRESAYDLVVIGAHGLGRVDRSTLGSVCERVSNLVDSDLLVVRNGQRLDAGKLFVAIDGSDQSFGALKTALMLGRTFAGHILAVAAYDPFFHKVAFNHIAKALSAEASRLFRFQEQERLHDEIIDEGLLNVYRSHLTQAQAIADKEGISIGTEVLRGKPFDAIASKVENVQPALLLVGRSGMHHGEGVTLGSTTENLLRCVNCNVLVVNNRAEGLTVDSSTSQDKPTQGEIHWSEEAQQRLERVPWFVRKMAQRRIEDFARENGSAVVSLGVYERARRRFGM